MDPLTIVSQSLPLAMAKQPYSFRLQAFGGTLPYVWQIVPGFGTPPTGVVLSGDTLQAPANAIAETSVGQHTFRIGVTDGTLTLATADVSLSVEPYGFSRTHQFLLDPRFKTLIEKYLVAGATREKVELHWFRDVVSTVAKNFVHLDRDILVDAWTGIYPYTTPADTDLRSVINALTGDLMYFAEPTKFRITSVVPGTGAYQVEYTITPPAGFFVGRNGETDPSMARQWFKLEECTSEDEPHDGDGNPLTIVRIEDADGIEINPNALAYQVDLDGFHSGKNATGSNIGYALTFTVEFVPNPHSRTPVAPFCVRSGIRQELHDLDPESFIKFGNVLGEVDADVIALIKTAPFVAGLKIGNQVVVPTAPPQYIELQGQNGIDLDADPSAHIIRIGSKAIQRLNGVEPDGSGDLDLVDGEFIEIETEVSDNKLTIKTVIPVQVPPGDPTQPPIHSKGLISREDYAKFLELISTKLTRLHGHTGEDVVLGTPGDGFSDGYIPLDPRASLVETIDRINEAMLTGFGAPIVQDLNNVDLVEIAGIRREHGYLADDSSGSPIGIVYETGVHDAGSEAPYVYNDASNISGSVAMEFETSIEFGPVEGTAGTADDLAIYLNGSLLESWTLATANPAVGPSPSGYMAITSVRSVTGTNDAIRLKGLVDPSDVTVAGLLKIGYNYFELKHVDNSATVTYTSAKFKVFLDSTVPAAGGPALPNNIYGSSSGKVEWMSGIKYYSGDNELLLTFTSNNLFEISYFSSPFQVRVNSPAGWQQWTALAWDDSHVAPVSSPPDALDSPVFAAYPTGRPVKDYSVAHGGPQPYLQLKHTRPGVAATQNESGKLVTPSGDDLIYTLHKAASTDLFEGFEDELYRINPYDPRWGGPDFPSFPSRGRDNFGWDPSRQLGKGTAPWGDGGGKPGDLQCIPNASPANLPWEGALVWPQYDYTSGNFDPAQSAGRDYSTDFGSTGAAVYFRPIIFKDLSRVNGTLQIVGIHSSQIGLSYLGGGGSPTGNVNLEIKFPGSKPNCFSGWMDLAKLATGTYGDGDGALVGLIRDVTVDGLNAVEIDWTGNGLNTRHAGEMIILCVTYRAASPVIYRITEIG
jgi:hypothetical protein